MLQKSKLKNLRKGPVVSCCSQEKQNAYGKLLGLESYIRSNTAHGIYKLDREVSETVMSGEAPDKLYKLEWFKWVMIQDETAPFQDDMLKLGHYVGPSKDVGTAMTTKILSSTDQLTDH